jgi:uncharacterized protein (TIGR03000 family)
VGGYYGGSYLYSDPGPAYLPPAAYDPPAVPPGGYAEPNAEDDVPPVPQDASPAPDNSARVRVRVPPGAEVWIGGMKSRQASTTRAFVSPPLTPGKSYTYTVRARWRTEEGLEEESREVRVSAGATAGVDFTARPPAEKVPAPPKETD